MFKNLPIELFNKICDDLGVLQESNLSFASSATRRMYKQLQESRLTAILSSATENQFLYFLDRIASNAKDGLAILQNPACKKILIEKRPKTLPHWMLSMVLRQPDLMLFLLADDDYRNSLKPSEYGDLLRNYPNLQAYVIAKAIRMTTFNETDCGELDEMGLVEAEQNASESSLAITQRASR